MTAAAPIGHGPSNRPSIPAHREAPQTLRVLLVESDEYESRLIRAALSDVRPMALCDVVTSLAEAEDRLASTLPLDRRLPVDVVLVDLTLPDSRGTQTFTRLQAAAPATPIVVLTGVDDHLLGHQLVARGAQDYLMKGRFGADGLIRTLRHAVERHALRSELHSLSELKDTFLRAVSHELRTPLTSVLGYAHTLEAHVDAMADDERDLALARLVTNAKRLDRLLGDLLDVDQLARGAASLRTTRTDVAAVALATVEAMELPDGSVRLDVVPAVAELDAPKIERVIENLVANARRHTPTGTTIWLRVAPAEAEVVIVVEDDGPGVGQHLHDTLFQPFVQGPQAASAPSPGTGIGLSLVKQFVELHGGRVTIEDRDGGGARFVVALPCRPVGSTVSLSLTSRACRVIESVGSRSDAVLALLHVVEQLGGEVATDRRADDPEVLPIDVSLGGMPLLVSGTCHEIRSRLRTVLPPLVEVAEARLHTLGVSTRVG